MKFILSLLLLMSLQLTAQKIQVLTSGERTSLRGLSVVSDDVVWVSGNNGMVGRSTDGGKTWKWQQVPGFEKTDFRDIEAFDSMRAVIMATDQPAYILKTTDAGKTWKVAYENNATGMFLDAMEFWNELSGIVIGDPINGRFFIARTFDGGNTWREIPKQYFPLSDRGEACFASSGTNIRKINKEEACFVSGGLHSRLYIREKRILLPIIQGKVSTGANSIAVKDNKTFIVVGGDFTTPDATEKNCVITTTAGKKWTAPEVAPHGYRSCVEYLSGNNWITCGLNGVDYSTDDGKTWNWISKESFNVCGKARDGQSVFLAGGRGLIGKLIL